MTEDDLEQLCLSWFSKLGWRVSYGPDLAPDSSSPERANYQSVLLQADIEQALRTINPHLPVAAIEQALEVVKKPSSLDLVTSNKDFHNFLLNGIPVEYKQEDKQVYDRAFLIDFNTAANNNFRVINQFTVQGAKQHTKQLRRPDIVCFINGLPIAVIELKSPSDEKADIWDAVNQLHTYKEELNDLFVYNAALVASDGYTARVGSLTANKERFMPWRTIKHEDDKPLLEWQLETLVRGFFNPELLLTYLRYFVLFETNENNQLIKKIAGYHQFHAVLEAVNATIIASQQLELNQVAERRATYGRKVQAGSKKAGVVWHTQGSGKSISMCCYAAMLLQHPQMHNPTLVVVTDRNDLDGQLFATFSSAYELLKQDPVQADDRDALRELLAAREAGGIIFTTVQKFALLNDESSHPVLNNRHNIVVISDEAHRSQYGLKATLKGGMYKYGYAKHLRDALPNASFIGFTGTPIAFEDKDTRAVFGDYVSIYDIQDAVDDGATVPIYYESRLARLDLNQAEIEALSDQVEEVIEDEEDDGARERKKGEWSRLEKLVGAGPRIQQVAEDIVQHFEERNKNTYGKALIVGMSREICAHLYNALVALRPEWHSDNLEEGAIKIMMTGTAADKALLQPHIYNNQAKKRLESRFKDPSDPLKIVIVRDMWLTGFDAPVCNTMYIDKPMKGHNLMQAIARVNRVFKDKPGGLVVDYIGIANDLKEALKTYTNAKGKGTPTLNVEEAFAILLEKLDVLRGMFAKTPKNEGFDYSDFATNPAPLMLPATNHILGLDDGKKRFLDTLLALSKANSLCSTLEQAQELQQEIAFFNSIKAAITKLTSVDRKLAESDKDSVLKQILDNAVIAKGVDDIFAMSGLDKPNISLMSEEFMEDVRRMPYKNFAVELLEKLLKDDIKSHTRTNLVQEKKYSDRLQATLVKYNNRGIEAAQVIEELIAMAKEFHAELERNNSLGLNNDEIAFYDALATNESAVRKLDDEVLKLIASELAERLRASTTVDWQVRETVRARLRILVRRILQKYKYPPDQAPEAVELILKQAEVLSNAWSAPNLP